MRGLRKRKDEFIGSACRGYPYAKTCGYWEFLKFERDLQGDAQFVAMTR